MNRNAGPRFPCLVVVSLPQTRGGGWSPCPLPFRKARALAISQTVWDKVGNGTSPDPNAAVVNCSHRNNHGLDQAPLTPNTVIGAASTKTELALYDGNGDVAATATGRNLSKSYLGDGVSHTYAEYVADDEMTDAQVQSGVYPGDKNAHYSRQLMTSGWQSAALGRVTAVVTFIVDETMWPDSDTNQKLVEG